MNFMLWFDYSLSKHLPLGRRVGYCNYNNTNQWLVYYLAYMSTSREKNGLLLIQEVRILNFEYL